MQDYYVSKNAQANGDHEVHESGCLWLPRPENRIHLGRHYSCSSAVVDAKRYFFRVNGCYHCSRPCHTSLERKPFCISISIGSSLWLRSRSGVLATTPSQGRYYLFPLGCRRLRKLLKRLDIQAVRITGQCLTNMAVLRQTSEEGQNARETFSKIPIWFRSGLNRAFFFANSENSPREANSPASFGTGMAKRYSKQGLPTGCRENTTVTP